MQKKKQLEILTSSIIGIVTWKWLHDFYVEISRKRSGRELDILVCVWIAGKWISRFGNLQ